MNHADKPRPRLPDRHRHVFEESCLDAPLPPDHRARPAWTFAERVDVSALEDAVAARGARAGAPAIAPRLLAALWPHACLDGVGGARELARSMSLPAGTAAGWGSTTTPSSTCAAAAGPSSTRRPAR